MRRSGVTVEFLGLPGVGKSSVSMRAAALLRARGFGVSQPAHAVGVIPDVVARALVKSWPVGREVLRHPVASLRATAAVIATRQTSRVVLFKMLFNWLLVAALMRRSVSRPGVHLFDQGIAQGIWSIGLSAADAGIDRCGERLIELVPLPDIVVVLRASPETVTQRLRRRGGRESRADAWTLDDHDQLTRAQRVMDEVLGLLRRPAGSVGAPRLLVLDDDQEEDGERCAVIVADAVEEMGRGRKA